MDFKVADRLETGSAPSGFKGARAHVIGACDNRRREKKRVFQGHAAEVGFQPVFIGNLLDFRKDLIMQPDHQGPDADLRRGQAGGLTGGRTFTAREFFAELFRRGYFVVKPDASQEISRIQLSAGCRAGSILAQDTADHIFTSEQIGIMHCSPSFP